MHKKITPLEPQFFKFRHGHMIIILPTHQHGSAHSADDMASETQVTRVKYNRYTLCRLKF